MSSTSRSISTTMVMVGFPIFLQHEMCRKSEPMLQPYFIKHINPCSILIIKKKVSHFLNSFPWSQHGSCFIVCIVRGFFVNHLPNFYWANWWLLWPGFHQTKPQIPCLQNTPQNWPQFDQKGYKVSLFSAYFATNNTFCFYMVNILVTTDGN